MSRKWKYFGLGVFGLFGLGGGILAGVRGHPAWAVVLIFDTLIIVFGAMIFDD